MPLDVGSAAVVTGGASGLGEAMLRALAANEVRVTIFDLQAEKGAALAAELERTFCPVDVSDDNVAAGLTKAREAHGQERVLVSCAGTANATRTASRVKADGTIRHFPLDTFERVVQINLIGTFRCIAHSAAGMLTLDPLPDGSGARSSTRPASRPRMDRRDRRPMPHPRPGSSA